MLAAGEARNQRVSARCSRLSRLAPAGRWLAEDPPRRRRHGGGEPRRPAPSPPLAHSLLPVPCCLFPAQGVGAGEAAMQPRRVLSPIPCCLFPVACSLFKGVGASEAAREHRRVLSTIPCCPCPFDRPDSTGNREQATGNGEWEWEWECARAGSLHGIASRGADAEGTSSRAARQRRGEGGAIERCLAAFDVRPSLLRVACRASAGPLRVRRAGNFAKRASDRGCGRSVSGIGVAHQAWSSLPGARYAGRSW